MRELNRRINNQFASAIDLISVQAVRAEGAEAKAVLADAVELLHAHAGVRRALLMPRYGILIDAARYLRKLCWALRGAGLERLNIQLTLKGDRLPLESERCWRLGLIVHELVTNAEKQACFDARSGAINIELVRTDGLLECVVSDNLSATRARHRQQIVGDLARTLNGRIKHGTGADLRSVVISFPLTERERRASGAINSRRLRSSRQVRMMASDALGEGGNKPLGGSGRCQFASAQDPERAVRAGQANWRHPAARTCWAGCCHPLYRETCDDQSITVRTKPTSLECPANSGRGI